ncbi:MAG: DNA polymerase III subunit gamma/tau [Planctomycetota bacterium]
MSESTENPAYTVLARRYRPQGFDEVVGQAHVSESLLNAIRRGRVAHAYLFTGARGVGKTSTARIFAKALNCPHAVNGVPCNNCELCEAVSAGRDVDVIEIDGASNNGVEDVRGLRANVTVKPMRAAVKVYIIDEVHMLSRGAFNALLKTLEEPPPNVKFVLCTTEPEKVPDTILSRCQRFDFSTVSITEIGRRLGEIAAAEGCEVDDAAIELVARRAAGSMRDSQSLFDQVLAFGRDRVTAADVHRLLGTADEDRLLALLDAIGRRAPAEALAEVDAACGDGVQVLELTDQLVALMRDVMVTAAGATSVPLTAVDETARGRMTATADAWGVATATAALQLLAESRARMTRSVAPRALLELAVVRLASLSDLQDLADLVASLRAEGTPASGQKKNSDVRPRLPNVAPASPPTRSADITTDREPAAATPPRRLAEANGSGRRPDPEFENESRTANGRALLRIVPGEERALRAALSSRAVGEAGEALAAATLAIRGPNRVAISPGPNYASRPVEFWESARGSLTELLREFSENEVHVEVEAAVAKSPEAGRPGRRSGSAVEKLDLNGLPDDPLLAAAVGLFEARDIRRQVLPDAKPPHEDATDHT